MKRETAKREIDSLDFYLQNHTNDYSEESHIAMMMAIDALNSSEKLSNVFDKVKVEIEKQDKWLSQAGYNAYNVDIALNAIKLTLAESEG